MSNQKKPLATLLKKIPKPVLAAMICCFIAGFIIHIFAFTNIIPNSDGLSRVNDAQQMTVSGRWFLHYATAFNGFVQMPAVIGLLSVLFMSLSAAFTTSLLEIKNPIIGGLCGALMIAFPSVAYTYCYMFTASAYFFGILLAVVAVWMVKRFKFGYLFAPLLLACAIGTYQAYLAVAAALSVIYVFLNALDEKKSAKAVLLSGLKFIAFLGIAVVLYFIILKVFLWAKDLELLSYKGANSMLSSLSLGGIITLLIKAYGGFIGYFFIGGRFCTYADLPLRLLNAALLIFAIIAFIKIAKARGLIKNKGKFLLSLLLLAVLPMALNLSAMMGDNTDVMRYALVFAYVFALALIDGATLKVPARFSLRSVGCIGAVCILFSSFLTSNLAYTVSAQAHRASLAFATNLVSRVETMEGYENGMEVVVIGAFPDSVYYCDIPAFHKVANFSCLSSSVMPLNKHIYYYANDWLNVRWKEPEEATMIAISDSEAFKSMPLYPSDGSVAISDGRVIVKLAEQYKPKADFEIAYENRR